MQKFAFKIDIHHRPDVKALLLNEMNLKKPICGASSATQIYLLWNNKPQNFDPK